MAPNAAAATVPIAYSTVDIPVSSTTSTADRFRIPRIILCNMAFPFFLEHHSQQAGAEDIAGHPRHHRQHTEADERRQETDAERSGDDHPGTFGGRVGRAG